MVKGKKSGVLNHVRLWRGFLSKLVFGFTEKEVMEVSAAFLRNPKKLPEELCDPLPEAEVPIWETGEKS